MSGEAPGFSIVDLSAEDEEAVGQAARLLVDGFRDDWPEAWPTAEEAQQEMQEALGGDRICRVALGEDGAVLGWIGGIPGYEGKVWELHPLVVRSDVRCRGIGRALVSDLEARVAERGALTLWLGSDDDTDMTTLSGKDLYPDVLGNLANIQNRRGHPYEFYSRLGFSLIGVMPDANGWGRPDIFMAKRCG